MERMEKAEESTLERLRIEQFVEFVILIGSVRNLIGSELTLMTL